MKKLLALTMSLLFLLITGCSAGNTEAEFAVEEELLKIYGNDQESVMEAYGLSEDKKDDIWPSYYLGEAVWCGEKRETQFFFWDGIYDMIKCGYYIENNEDAHEEVERIFETYIQQFGEPKTVLAQVNFVFSELQEYKSDEKDALLEAFWKAEEEAYLSFDFVWSSEEEDGPNHVECIFYRKENTNPGYVYIIHHLNNGTLSPAGEDTDLNEYI